LTVGVMDTKASAPPRRIFHIDSMLNVSSLLDTDLLRAGRLHATDAAWLRRCGLGALYTHAGDADI
jgi:hypothetical protein